MKFLNYSQLYSWRNLCEWLNTRWYKFAYISQIEADKKLKCLPFAYSASGRELRSLLYLNYKIQFISYRVHPVTNYWSKRRILEQYNREVFYKKGWMLVSDWEFKIDFLEKVILLNSDRDSLEKMWLPRLERRIQARENERSQKELKKQIAAMDRYSRYLAGYCPNCNSQVVALMLDCPNCGRSYE